MKREQLHTNKNKGSCDFKKGFSLVEILVAVSVFLIFVLATMGVISKTSTNAKHALNNERAFFLADEAIEAARNLRDENDNFASLPDGTYGLTTTGNQWNLSGISDIQDIFTRTVTISTINGSQKRVRATVSWSDQVSTSNSISTDTYLTNWQAPLQVGLTVDKSVVNYGGTKVPSDFLPTVLTALAWDYSVDPPVQVTTDFPIAFSPSTMSLPPNTYSFLTSNDPNYSVALSSDCTGNSITLADGDSKICNITYEEYAVPTVISPTVTDITQTGATLGANVTWLGNPAAISARGTCWSTTSAPTSNCVAEGGTTTGVFTQARTGFSCNTLYYYRGYATNSKGTGYSADGTFTTSSCASLPTVTTTSPVTSITRTTAVGGGNVTSDGGAAVTARGVVWDTSADPTIALSTKTSNGTGTGSFTSNITSLTCNTLYYVRAYATNSVGTSYGANVTFTTAACSSVVYVGSASAGGTTVTIPAHQIGDLLVIFAYRDGNNTAPSLPAGWTNIGTADGASNNSSRLGYRVATATNTTSGTWTNATGLVVHVYRGQNSVTPIGGNGNIGGNSTIVTYPALTMTQTDGSSWVAGFSGHRSIDVSLQTPPAGMTNRTNFVNATNEVAGHDTNIGVSSWNTSNVNVGGTSSGWRARTLEILSQ